MRVNALTASEPTPEEGELTSFAETAKNLFQKHKKKIYAVGAVSLALVGALASLAYGQDDTEDSEALELFSEPSADERPKRAIPGQHPVKGSLVDIGDRRASARARENYRRDEGGELPPGKTYRPSHSRGGPANLKPNTPPPGCKAVSSI